MMKNKFFSELFSLVTNKNSKFLLAISGGIDSMVLAYLFRFNNIKFSIAHCNFKLRGQESDGDELFIKKYAENNEVNFFCKKFETTLFAKKNKISIQMAARKLRYKWFKDLSSKEKFDYIVTAHHYDDIIETVFINLSRATSISGLTGIKKIDGKIIRPLLSFKKNDIINYSKEHQIKYREDSSNVDEKYVRNKIRHSILTEFEKINPNFKSTFNTTLTNLSTVGRIYQNFISKEIKKIIQFEDGIVKVNIEKLKESSEPKAILYEIIKQYNFSDLDSIFSCMNSESGREFFSNTHYLVKDRQNYLISKIINSVFMKINESTDKISMPISMTFNLSFSSNQNKSKKIALLNYNKLSFPLTLRSYKKGDWFIPSGMKGKKKLSDYFIDNKFSMIDKKKCLVLCSQEDIIWVVGHRVDERYKLVGTQEKAYICQTK